MQHDKRMSSLEDPEPQIVARGLLPCHVLCICIQQLELPPSNLSKSSTTRCSCYSCDRYDWHKPHPLQDYRLTRKRERIPLALQKPVSFIHVLPTSSLLGIRPLESKSQDSIMPASGSQTFLGESNASCRRRVKKRWLLGRARGSRN